VPRYFDEQIVNMRAGPARGFTVPRVSVIGRDKTIEPYVKGDSTNPLYAPFTLDCRFASTSAKDEMFASPSLPQVRIMAGHEIPTANSERHGSPA
jgi:uncharacterized protein (DUF885 family)